MTSPVTSLLDLPLSLVRELLDMIVHTLGLTESAKLRLVCKLFACEIPQAICRTRALEEEEGRCDFTSITAPPFVTTYVFNRVISERGNRGTLSSRLYRILSILFPGMSPSDQVYQVYLESLVDAVTNQSVQVNHSLDLLKLPLQALSDETTFLNDCLCAAAFLRVNTLFDDIISNAKVDFTVDKNSLFRESPLVFACMGGAGDLVAKILHTKYLHSVNTTRSELYSSLRGCILRGHDHIVGLFLDSNFLRSNFEKIRDIKTFPSLAAEANNLKLFQILCDKLDTSVGMLQNINEASRHGHIEIVKYCLEHGADVNANVSPYPEMYESPSPLQLAAFSGFTEIVQLLLLHGANPTEYFQPDSPLTAASRKGHLEIVKILLAAGAVPVHHGYRSPLVVAVRNGHIEVARVLLDTGIKEITCYQNRALTMAAGGGYESLLRMLIHRGISVDGGFDPSGIDPPILAAMIYGQPHIVRTLLELGAKKIDPKDGFYASKYRSSSYPMPANYGVKPDLKQPLAGWMD